MLTEFSGGIVLDCSQLKDWDMGFGS